MEKSLTTAVESINGPVCCNNQNEHIATGPLVVEFIQYDDERRFSYDSNRFVTFDVSSWSADRLLQFWEFMHSPVGPSIGKSQAFRDAGAKVRRTCVPAGLAPLPVVGSDSDKSE